MELSLSVAMIYVCKCRRMTGDGMNVKEKCKWEKGDVGKEECERKRKTVSRGPFSGLHYGTLRVPKYIFNIVKKKGDCECGL